MKKQALIVIDVQNDYFPQGKFPLWNPDTTLEAVLSAIQSAKAQDIPVILVQHVAAPPAPFFNPDTEGVAIHPAVLKAAPEAPVIVKEQADSFLGTTLQETLEKLQVEHLLLCGMMTHNCVTHTAISKHAENYEVSVIAPACTTVSEILHQLALHALSARVVLRDGV